MAQSQTWVTNNTNYNLTIEGLGDGNTTIGPFSSTRIITEYENVSKNFLFWIKQNLYYMQGSLSYGQSSGVYVDRGDLPIDDQSITLQINIGDRQWVQSTNGGNTLLSPSEYSSNDDILLTFYG